MGLLIFLVYFGGFIYTAEKLKEEGFFDRYGNALVWPMSVGYFVAEFVDNISITLHKNEDNVTKT